MRKTICLLLTASVLFVASCSSKKEHTVELTETETEENEMYDGPAEAAAMEAMKTMDPALGYVPRERLLPALDYTNLLKTNYANRGIALLWTERGPIYDSVGSSNGNGRGGGAGTTAGYTSGRVTGFFVDYSDATGNTVYCGGVAGGVWKCTNFLAAEPNWQPINDYLSNMNVVSLCQDPTNANTMYFATGEAYSSFDQVLGNGVWKSTDHGITWTRLTNTSSYTRAFKIMCDASGNVYLATRGFGLVRSTNGGTSWTTITPSGLSTSCTDIEITSTGKLHASFGYGGSVAYRYTASPATVTSGTWSSGTGLFATTPNRFVIAALGDVVYGVTTNSSNNFDNCYKSVDGGATWTKTNSSTYTVFTSGQGWYDVSLAINPDNTDDIMMGQLDAYRSGNSGATLSRSTYWVGSGAYVHADHHLMEWFSTNGESRIIMGTDGGIFYSNDGGGSFVDKNKNLNIKQFYSCALHPTNTDYIFGGAQDNGNHLIKKPGLTYSTEVVGGDGGFTHIDQNEPQFYMGAYVYNQFRRSTNGGTSFSSFNFGPSTGIFINPWAYDDVENIVYACGGTGTVFRWNNPTTATNVSNSVTGNLSLSNALSSTPMAFAVSPYTSNLLYVGTSGGHIISITSAHDGSGTETLLNSASGSISSISVGTSDNFLVATSSSYGVSQVRYSSNGGSTWTSIDGNLPDMPVRWAVFHPTDNNKIVIATEAGVYTTTAVNGASTQWFPSPGFPLVRTDMLEVRKSDNTIVAATHGRGMFTANILSILPLRNLSLSGSVNGEATSALNWTSVGASSRCKYYVQYSTDGVNFKDLADFTSATTQYRHTLTAAAGYYRIMGVEPGSAPTYSNIIVLKSSRRNNNFGIQVSPNPVASSMNVLLTATASGEFNWQITDLHGRVRQTGKGQVTAGNLTFPVNVSGLFAGTYYFTLTQGSQKTTTGFLKQ